MSHRLPLGEVSVTPPVTHRLAEPSGQITAIFTRHGSLHTGREAAEAHGQHQADGTCTRNDDG